MLRPKYAVLLTAVVCVIVILVACGTMVSAQTEAEKPASEYVGTEVCTGCHEETGTEFLLTPHRRTLAKGRDEGKTGCESCHGPGGAHVEGGGDKTKIRSFYRMDTASISKVCLSCHKQPDVMQFGTSSHAASKIGCTNCHKVHEPGQATMLQQIEAKQYSMTGLALEISEAEHRLSIASTEAEKEAARARLDELNAKKAELKKSLDVAQTRLRRTDQSELCYSCHKSIQAQFKQASHHPVPEQKMECVSCHNPHGGPKDNLREETVNQTCYKCHPGMEGPNVFEHPPVSEDCTICHKPHGSSQNKLLRQSEPFLCLKCHVGPHSRSGTFANGETAASTSRVPYYYAQCTSCHNRPHGSDRHPAFHF